MLTNLLAYFLATTNTMNTYYLVKILSGYHLLYVASNIYRLSSVVKLMSLNICLGSLLLFALFFHQLYASVTHNLQYSACL